MIKYISSKILLTWRYDKSSCRSHIRDLRHICHIKDFTAFTIDSSVCRSITTQLLQLTLSLTCGPRNQMSPTISKFSSLRCHPHSKARTNHFCTQIAALSNRAYNSKLFQLLTVFSTNLNQSTCINDKHTGKTHSSDHLCLSRSSSSSLNILIDPSLFPLRHLWKSLPTKVRSFSQLKPSPTSANPLSFSSFIQPLFLSHNKFFSHLKTPLLYFILP